MNDGWVIRPGRQSDAEALVALVGGVYREYGDEPDVDGYDRDLLDVGRHYGDAGGAFVVLEADGVVVGAHATRPVDVGQGIVTFRRLYVHRQFRGTGVGPALMDWALRWSRDRGFTRIEFWSDTRFTRAHRFFARYGFVRGEVRHVEEGALVFSEYRFWGKIEEEPDPRLVA